MIRLIFFFQLAFALMLSADERQTRLDITVAPEAARLSIDGVFKGMSPLSVFGIEPGLRLLHLEAPGYKAVDEYVEFEEGAFVRRAYELEPQTGLLLVQTEPSGAEVRYDGVSLGVTPLFLSTLVTDHTHTFELVRAGCRNKRVQVLLKGRKPVVLRERLMVDSAILNCASEPAGALVTVNGVERGKTPIEITDVPKGNAQVSFTADGYATEVRDLRLLAGEKLELSVTLTPQPVCLKVVSEPDLARIFLDGDYQGKSPLTLDKVKPGEHTLKVEKNGFATITRKVSLPRGAKTTETFSLKSVLGTLEIVTTPPGVKVSVDGRIAGVTSGTAEKSDVFSIGGLVEGEHQVVLHLAGYADQSLHGKVEAGKAVRINRRLRRVFSPDTEVETINGLYRGVLMPKESSANFLRIEVREGITQDIRRSDIRSIRPITK